jgi:hypothetical protein
MGGFPFTYSDSHNVASQEPGKSTALLASDGTLCMSGYVMRLPPDPTQKQYEDYWGCGIGVGLDRAAKGGDAPDVPHTLAGTGITVDTTAIPACTTARIVLDDDGAKPEYCALFRTPGVEIPWRAFNTECWNNPPTGKALTGPPATRAIKVQLVTSVLEACPFRDFCITRISP